uniref:Uncharacterized protein n=1 Tax=Glossina pallidipes TaxID=7398 RepID=A0A1B0AIM7_GLOPL
MLSSSTEFLCGIVPSKNWATSHKLFHEKYNVGLLTQPLEERSSVFDEDELLSWLTIRVPATPDVASSFGQYTVLTETAIDNFNTTLPESAWLNAVVTMFTSPLE